MRYHFTVLRDRPDLELHAGDTLSYDPGDATEPYLLHRPIQPDAGALLAAMESGEIEGTIPPALIRQRAAVVALPALRPPTASAIRLVLTLVLCAA